MTVDTQRLRRLAKVLCIRTATDGEMIEIQEAADQIDEQRDEIKRLQRIINSRPAINAGLPGTYIEWSQSIYAMEAAHAEETRQ